jgi:hypothetical protein
MNTKLIMTLSALTMGAAGVILSFMPQEILQYFNGEGSSVTDPLILQLIGALYFSFSMLNWTSRANLIGGIYARPVAIGNLTHFTMGALVLIKGYFSHPVAVLIIPAVIYTVFAVCYAVIFFRHPINQEAAA